MNSTILQLKIKLGALEKELKECFCKIKRLTYEIHELVPACWTDVFEIKAEENRQASEELVEECHKYKALQEKICEIKRELGV